MGKIVGAIARACGDFGFRLVKSLGVSTVHWAKSIGQVVLGFVAAVTLMMAALAASPGWAQAAPEISVTVGGETIASGGTYTFLTNPDAGVATPLSIVISNSGVGNLILSGSRPSNNPVAGIVNVSGADFTAYSTNTVAAGGSATTTLSLTPTSDGAFALQFQIVSDDADESPYVINLAGTAGVVAPQMEVEIDGQAIVAGGSKMLTGVASGIETTAAVTVRNTGNADLVLTGTLATVGTATNISSARVTNLNASAVAPGGSVTGTVAFIPAASGSFSQAYYWMSNDPTSPTYTISLSGNAAVGPQLGVRYNGNAVADGASVSVGDLPTGVTTDVTFSFANTGLLPLEPNYFYADNPTNATFSAGQTDHLRYVYAAVPSLAAGATYDVTVPITPTAAGAVGFDLRFNSNNGAPRQADIRVTANGVVPPEIRVVDRGTGSEVINGNSSTTGTFEAGVSANVIFDIHNDGGSDLNITALPTISLPYNTTLGDLTVGPNLTGAFQIPATSRTGVAQAVTPTEPGFFSFNVTIPSDDADENPYAITMIGIVQDTTAPSVTAVSQVIAPDLGVRTRVAEPTSLFTASDSVGVRFKWAEIGGTVYGGPDRTGFPGPATYEFPEGQTTVTAFARDAAGNETSQNFSVYVSDTTPPVAPVLTMGFGDQGELVGEVRGELGTTVTLSFPDGSSQTGVLRDFGDGTGQWSIGTASGMPSGTVTAYLTDVFGNVSGTTTYSYVDTTAPLDPTNLFVDLWADGTVRVTGKCEPNSIVSIYWPGTRTVDTVQLASDSVDFAYRTTGGRPSGEVFVTCTDPSGNTTNRVSAGSFSDTSAPDTPTTATVLNGVDGTVFISGTVEPGATVYVTFPDGQSGTVYADASGNYSAISFPGQPNGSFTVEVEDSSGNRSGVYTGTYTDETAPSDPRYIKNPSPDANGALTISVRAEFGAFFTVTWPDGSTETKQHTDPELKALEFTSPGGQPSGDITGQIADRNGNRSNVVTLTTYSDTTPPAPPSGTTVTGNDDGSITVSGTAEPFSTVTVTFPDGSTASVKAGNDGTYTATSEPGQTTGKVAVSVTDQQGNPAASGVSEDYIDDTPPAAPTIDDISVASDGSVEVSGTTEPGGMVTVTFPDGSTGQATADENGNFVIKSSASMTSGTVSVQTQDQADNTSGSSTQLVFTDTVPPEVVLSGAPDGFSSVTSFTIDITFDEDVTGFAATDIAVTNATVDSFSGSGASYQAGITTTGVGDVTISVPAGVAQDGTGNLNNASNELSLVNATVDDTEEAIAQFLQTRAQQLLSNQPNVVGFLRGGATDGSLVVSRQDSGTNLSFDSRLGGDVWSKLTASVQKNDDGRSDYVFGVVGSHRKINEDLLIGGMLQFDHVSQADGDLTTSGTGWMVGPYFAMKVKDQPLYVDGRLLAGKSRNTISPFGTYEDEFETSRLLAQLNVTGELHKEQITWLPVLGLSYLKDRQAAYVDGLGNSISARTLKMTEISLGLHFEKALPRPRGSLEVTGGFGIHKASTRNVGGVDLASTDSDSVRGRIDLGLAQRNGRGGSFDISGFVDGLGRASKTLGLELGVGWRF